MELNLEKRKKLTDIENEPMVAGEKDAGRDSQGFWDGHVHIAIFKMDKQQGLLRSTGNSAECHVTAWMGGRFAGEWVCVYVWLSPFTVHLKVSQHCQLAILQYKIKS